MNTPSQQLIQSLWPTCRLYQPSVCDVCVPSVLMLFSSTVCFLSCQRPQKRLHTFVRQRHLLTLNKGFKSAVKHEERTMRSSCTDLQPLHVPHLFISLLHQLLVSGDEALELPHLFVAEVHSLLLLHHYLQQRFSFADLGDLQSTEKTHLRHSSGHLSV